MRVPKVVYDIPRPTVVPPSKCRTCAYHTKPKTEDLEMSVFYYLEKPEPHPCHERRGVYCLGAHEVVTEIEAVVKRRMA